jgi:hypothetical protein
MLLLVCLKYKARCIVNHGDGVCQMIHVLCYHLVFLFGVPPRCAMCVTFTKFSESQHSGLSLYCLSTKTASSKGNFIVEQHTQRCVENLCLSR